LKNQNITKDVMMQKMKILIQMISEAYFEVSNLNIAPDELHNWKQGILKLMKLSLVKMHLSVIAYVNLVRKIKFKRFKC